MTDPSEIEAKSNARFEEIENRLYELPKFKAALEDSTKRPIVLIQCPNHHRLAEVILEMDTNWHPYLVATSEEDSDNVADGWENLFGGTSGGAISSSRVKFKCSQCGYPGTWTQARLLGLYAVAMELGKTKIRLKHSK